VPDRNVALEIRASGDHPEQLPQLAKDLVASNVDVILTFSYPAAMAAKNATTTIPIVATESGGDPISTGLTKSLSRPSGNVTGVSDMAIELAPKRLELLKDMVPTLRAVAMLWNESDPGMTLRYQAAAAAARTIGARVQPLGVREPKDFDGLPETKRRQNRLWAGFALARDHTPVFNPRNARKMWAIRQRPGNVGLRRMRGGAGRTRTGNQTVISPSQR
jgi:putative ABC transport system substrate-binding protein